jgi:putative aminopeptidase FrvX
MPYTRPDRHAPSGSAALRQRERLLVELTSLPTAAGCEDGVIAFVEKWVRRRRALALKRDRYGNLMIQRRAAGIAKAARKTRRPLFHPLVIEAHLDHPAFVVTEVIDDRHIGADFRGGVEARYFIGSTVDLHHGSGVPRRGRVRTIDRRKDHLDDHYVTIAFPRRVAAAPGDVLTWSVGPSRITRGRLYAPACDNLAGVAAALTSLDLLLQSRVRPAPDVRVLLTRAEEVGFVGAIAAAKGRLLPRDAAIVVLECSKALPDAPIGAGPIVRVGDKTHCFSPEITYALSHVAAALAARDPRFQWQRKLMTGGTCNASAYHSLGQRAGCVCLPLGNYHNMRPTAGASSRPRIGPEVISVADWHGLVRLLVEAGLTLGRGQCAPDFADVLNKIFNARRGLLA